MRTLQQMFYTGRRWRKLRDRALDAQPLCARCEGRGLIAEANTVHHKTPVDWPKIKAAIERRKCRATESEIWRVMASCQPHAVDPANLECVCRDCHEALHGRGKGQISEDRAAIRALGAIADS